MPTSVPMTTLLADFYRPTVRQTIWQWAAENVDFSLNRAYPVARNGKYDPDWLPFFRQPVEDIQDRAIREVVFCKCSQAGGTENLLLNPIRYAVARAPVPILYVSGQQEQTEAFLRERLKGGLLCSRETRKRYRAATERSNEIYFDDMILATTWSRSDQGLKSRPVGWVMADEVSIWPVNALDRLRKRMDTYPFPCLVIVSSPDPNTTADNDPIFAEFDGGNRCYWMMPDPRTGNLFRYHMGFRSETGEESRDGLKWDQAARDDDGNWDMERVRKSARYVTPDGTVLAQDRKNRTTRSGHWVPTNPDAPVHKASYHLNCFHMPWFKFGDIAVAFLEHKARGKDSLRVFICEWLAERWHSKRESPIENEITRCQAEYQRGKRFAGLEPFATFYEGKQIAVIMTIDVQKDHFWYVVREWVEGGSSGLIEWGRADSFAELDEKAKTHEASWMLIDSGYGERTGEVYLACMEMQMIPTKGFERRLLDPWKQSEINPLEGKRSGDAGLKIARLDFDTDIFKTSLMQIIKRETDVAWWVYGGIEREYMLQVTSEEKADGKWIIKRGRGRRNHIWDCEVLQLLGATRFGFYARPILPEPQAPVAQEAEAE